MQIVSRIKGTVVAVFAISMVGLLVWGLLVRDLISPLVGLLFLLIGTINGVVAGKYVVGKKIIEWWDEWSISIYSGPSILDLKPHERTMHPVVSLSAVKDVLAETVADPFILREAEKWYLFFEVVNAKRALGEIGLATSEDGLTWNYERIILREPFHLSYPYVFKWGNSFYMVPETHQTYSVRLYKSVTFPYEWAFEATLLYGHYVDPTLFRAQEKWWMFVTDPENNAELRLFGSNDLIGSWIEHPASPILTDTPRFARSAGRVIKTPDHLIRFAQDCASNYGFQVFAFKIEELDDFNYRESLLTENPILTAGPCEWNRDGMHHVDPLEIDPDRWIACVDGKIERLRLLGLKIV